MSKFRFKLAAENEAVVTHQEETDLADIHDLDLDAAMEELSEVISQTDDDMGRGLDIAQSNTDIAAILSEGGGEELSVVETNLLRVSANLAASGYEDDPDTLVAATESFMSRSAAIEASKAKTLNILENITRSVGNMLKKMLDSFTFFAESANRLRTKIIDAQKHVKSLSSNVQINVTRSNLLLHGKNNVIDNFKELKTETQVAIDFYTQSLNIASDSLKSSKLANIKSLATLGSTENLESILEVLEKTTGELIKAGKMSVYSKDSFVTEYTSPTFMGNSTWGVIVPTKTRNRVSDRTGSRLLLFGAYRAFEFRGTNGLTSGGVPESAGFQETVSKNDLLGLLGALLDSSKELNAYSNFNAKFSHFLNIFDAGVAATLTARTSTNVYLAGLAGLPLLFKTSRALRSLLFMNLGLLSTMFYKYKKTVTYITGIAATAR